MYLPCMKISVEKIGGNRGSDVQKVADCQHMLPLVNHLI